MIIVIHLKYSVVHHCFDIVSESFDFLLLVRLGKIKTNKIQVISIDSQFLYNSEIDISLLENMSQNSFILKYFRFRNSFILELTQTIFTLESFHAGCLTFYCHSSFLNAYAHI